MAIFWIDNNGNRWDKGDCLDVQMMWGPNRSALMNKGKRMNEYREALVKAGYDTMASSDNLFTRPNDAGMIGINLMPL